MRFSVPEVAPRPHPRVVDGTVAGARVVFHLDDRRLHVLNPSASAIWTELGDAETVGEVVIRVADRFGVEPWAVRDDVQRLIERLRGDGLVTVDDRVGAVRCVRPAPAPLPAGDRLPGCGSYLGLRAALAVETDDEEIGRVLHAVLAPLLSDLRPTTAIRITAGDAGVWELTVGHRDPVRLASKLAVVHRVLAQVNDAAIRSVPDDLVLHAGAVSGAEGAALLPAAANHGKSTLTTALVAAGLDYLTDEAAAVADGLVVRPYPKSIVLEPGSFALFADLEPRPDVPLGRALAGRAWHIDAGRVGTVGEATPVRVIVCPHWRAGAPTRVHRFSPAEAMHVLLGEAFDFADGGQPVFDRLAQLVESVPAYRLGYSDLGQAVETVCSLIVDPG